MSKHSIYYKSKENQRERRKMIESNTPQPVMFIESAIVNELQRIHASDVKSDQSLSMVQANVVDPRYEPQNGMYETEYDGMTIAAGNDLLVNFGE